MDILRNQHLEETDGDSVDTSNVVENTRDRVGFVVFNGREILDFDQYGGGDLMDFHSPSKED